MKTVVIDGSSIQTTKDIYQMLNQELDFGPYFGNNINALWDVLSTDVERPFVIHWINAEVSKKQMGYDFDLFVDLFHRLEEYDQSHSWEEKFQFHIDY